MKKQISYLFILSFGINFSLNSQSFVNGDLDGIAGISLLPTSWQSIPFTKSYCIATGFAFASPDLTSLTAPDVLSGINGNAYYGNTFVSGLHTKPYHEGIMQTVTNFVIGNKYTICFFQSVVKQINALDESGSWSIYIDDIFIETTLKSTSNLPYNSTNLKWEKREVSFIATSTSQTIGFLPTDDDINDRTSLTDITGALRMGIDSIYIKKNKSIIVKKKIKCVIYVPNAFSPNKDGVNDIFQPKLSCKFVSFKIMIFNRWGEKIFENENPKIIGFWDGTHNNNPVPNDVYVYRIIYTDDSGQTIEKIGHVLILK